MCFSIVWIKQQIYALAANLYTHSKEHRPPSPHTFIQCTGDFLLDYYDCVGRMEHGCKLCPPWYQLMLTIPLMCTHGIVVELLRYVSQYYMGVSSCIRVFPVIILKIGNRAIIGWRISIGLSLCVNLAFNSYYCSSKREQPREAHLLSLWARVKGAQGCPNGHNEWL